MFFKIIFKVKFLFLFIFLVSCTGETLIPIKGPETDGVPELNFAQFDDIPIPIGSTLDQKNSIIISKKEAWLGRLTVESNKSQLEVFDFFRNELPKFGWKKLSEISSDTSILNYQNQSRLALIQIKENLIYGSNVMVTVTELEESK